MEYAELNLYSLQGGDEFLKKGEKKDTGEEKMDAGDKKILRMYKKKIIEQY